MNGHAHGLDAASRHFRGQYRLIEQVGDGLGNEPPFALAADQVPRASHALQGPRHIAG